MGTELSPRAGGSWGLRAAAETWGGQALGVLGALPRGHAGAVCVGGAGWGCRPAHLSTTKAEALWLTEAECSVHRPPGSSRVWME